MGSCSVNSNYFILGIVAVVFAIAQAIDGARRKRASALASGIVPPTPAAPDAPVPPVAPAAEVVAPEAQQAAPAPRSANALRLTEGFFEVILAGWSPFYTFCF